MPLHLPLSPLFLANLGCFLQLHLLLLKKKKKKKVFSLPLPCEKPTQTTGKTGYLYAGTVERLSHRQQPKKTGRKIDFSLQLFQTHDLETYYSNNRQEIFSEERPVSICFSLALMKSLPQCKWGRFGFQLPSFRAKKPLSSEPPRRKESLRRGSSP